jgi:hypothetical protein
LLNLGDIDLFGHPEFPIPRRTQSGNKDAEFVRMALRSQKAGLEFTEIMTGHIHIGNDISEFDVAERIARGHCQEARFFLSVHAYDMNTLLSSNGHKAMLTGTFTSGALPASPYMVIGGEFHLFTDDEKSTDTKNLVYDFDMTGTDGSKIHFHGEKIVNDMAAFSIPGTWKATTTLNVTLSELSSDGEEEGKILGRGILVIDPWDLLHELKTMTANMMNTSSFLGYFVKELAHVFFAPFTFLSWPGLSYESWSEKNGPYKVFPVIAKDRVKSSLKVWEPLEWPRGKQPVDILFIAGAAVDETIFALPTVKKNAITFFREQGYRCFSVVHRVGKTSVAKAGYTTYDARLDVAAAIDKIEELRKSGSYLQLAEKTYIIAHCAGSMATAAGLLSGDIDPCSIAGITASNVFFTPRFPIVNRLKASLPIPDVYPYLAHSGWFDCNSSPRDTFFQLGLNQLLRFYPVRTKKDICTSVVCHRGSLAFGTLYSHHNLNSATHSQMHRFLGGTTMQNLKHLVKMGQVGHVLRTNYADDLVTEANIERMRGIPIFLFSGSENTVYDPESTKDSYDMLQSTLGEQNYRREVFESFGHLDCWMSDRSVNEVYPAVLDHLKSVSVQKRLGLRVDSGLTNGHGNGNIRKRSKGQNGHA